MSGGTINGRKPRIGFVENQVEIGSRQDDRFNPVASLQYPRKLAQLGEVVRRNLALGGELQINAMNFIDLLVLWADDGASIKHPEQLAVDGVSRAE